MKVRLVLVVVEGYIVEVTRWERRIAGSWGKIDGAAAAAAAAADNTSHPGTFARDANTSHRLLIAGAVQRLNAVAGTLCRAHFVP